MNYRKSAYILALMLFFLLFFKHSVAYNYEYVNVTSRVNITNARPEIDSIIVEQNILLNAGSTKVVNCNVSLHDWNGYADINSVNATFWDNSSVTFGSADNPNNHYTNTSCRNVSQDSYYANYTCSFDVYYYANNGTNWLCNVTVIDNYNFNTSGQDSTTILTYYALNITTPLIDYGNMELGDYSPNITVNITNIGNGNINISVLGYGGNNKVTGTGYAMFCQSGNITIGNERFSVNQDDDWVAKTQLSSTLQNITGLSIPKTTVISPTWNVMYWQLYTDPTYVPFGLCNGTVEFNAYAG